MIVYQTFSKIMGKYGERIGSINFVALNEI
jgi:aspartate/tyrosine/aromatic aminotransferase